MTRTDGHNLPRLSYAVAFLERSLRRMLAEALSPFDLTLAHYTVLSLLGIRDALSNAQLARRAYVTPQAMSEIVRYLEKRDLVVRAPSPDHARIHPATLTARGRSVLGKCDEAVDLVEQQMVSDAAVPDGADLVQTLMQYARALENGTHVTVDAAHPGTAPAGNTTR
jgi:DNA-binding MarR family transcriptional regulator